METKLPQMAASARPTVVVPMWPNRHFKRVGAKALRCLSHGTKAPGRVKALLGDDRMVRLRRLAVAQKLAAAL